MASIRDLKKDINFVLGDIIEAVYQWEADTNNPDSSKGIKIVDDAIAAFDDLMDKVNQNVEGSKKEHFKNVRKELEQKATTLIEQVNGLAA